MNRSLTVVLPVHNAEAALEQNLRRVMDLAGDLTTEFGVLVVDDGSTDDTFDVARELAARYPQIRVMRNAVRRGLGPTLSRLHARIKSDVVLVHDGTSNIDVEEIRSLWLSRDHRVDEGTSAARPTLAELRATSQTHAAMQRAHGRIAGFQILNSLIDTNSGSKSTTAEVSPRAATPRPGVGTIPPIPKSNLFGTITVFAMSE